VKFVKTAVTAAATLAAVAVLSFAPAPAHAQGCGSVTIADMNWSSATFMAALDRFILDHGYGCDASVVPGDTMPTGTSMMEKGEPDVAPELWTNSFTEALDAGVKEGRLLIAGKSLSDGGEEGFWVPKYLVDKDPSLATIEGVIANASMFKHPEDPKSSMFMGCPSGWNCQISAGNLFKALNLKDAGFQLVDPGSGAGLAGSIEKAYNREEPWFGYYWAPTPLLGRFEMVKVDFGTGIDFEHYQDCISQKECENPKPTMYPQSPVQTVVAAGFAKRVPDAFAYLQRRSFTNAFMNGFLAWMDKSQADGETAAVHFLQTEEEVWTKWVSTDVAAKLRAAIASM